MHGFYSSQFTESLIANDLDGVRQTPKSDLHSHAGRGGSAAYIASWANVKIPPPPEKFESLGHMDSWLNDNIKIHCPGLQGYLKRLEASFAQADYDNVSVLALSFSIPEVDFVGGMDAFINILSGYNQKFAPNTTFLPELTFDRSCNTDAELDRLDELLAYNYFRSIDICCNEFAQPIKNFKNIYTKAKSHSLKLKAHIGEFGTADDVMEAVEILELDEVHHGVAAATSPQIMKWLAEHNIRLNICPTSNVMLRVAESYSTHPIKKLYDAGVLVTINTDDLLIFNQSASQEYLNLFNCGLMSAEELNNVRINGLT